MYSDSMSILELETVALAGAQAGVMECRLSAKGKLDATRQFQTQQSASHQRCQTHRIQRACRIIKAIVRPEQRHEAQRKDERSVLVLFHPPKVKPFVFKGYKNSKLHFKVTKCS